MNEVELKNYDYYKTLLNPEIRQNAKIPSTTPLTTSCVFQLKSTVSLYPNNNGDLLFIMNPFFLANHSDIGKEKTYEYSGYPITVFITNYISSAWYSMTENWDQEDEDVYQESVDMGQTIPDIYQCYRLVSGSLTVKYLGEHRYASGVIGGAILEEKLDNTIGGEYYEKYGEQDEYDPDELGFPMYKLTSEKYSLDNIQNMPYHQEYHCIEGLRMLYYPIDNSFFNFYPIFNINKTELITTIDYDPTPIILADDQIYKTGFNWLVYTMGCDYGGKIKFDICLNFEGIPKTEYMEYIEMSNNYIKMDTIIQKNIIDFVRKNAIQKYRI